MGENGFHVVDYIVFLATLGVSLGIGLWFACKGRNNKNTGEYLMGGRNLKIIPVALSILVSFVSAVGILGGPAEMYAYGTQYSLSVVAAGVGCFLGAMVFVPLFYPLKLTSSFEYLELRYRSRVPRLFGTCLALFTQTFTVGAGFFAPSSALEAVTGFPVWLSMVLCGLTAAVYTTLGGMKAVIWTDVFQSVVIFLGLVTVVIAGTIKVGGFGEVWKYNEMYDRIQFFNMTPDPTERATFWSIVIVMSVLWMCVAASQPAVQRYCALPNMRAAKSAVLMNIPGQVVLGVLTSLSGIVVFAHYAKVGCDPIYGARKIKSPNQILPFFVMDVLGYPGVPGLFVACLYSGALSTASSSLNAMAAVTWEDVLKGFLGHLSDERQTLVTKILVGIYGLLGLATGFIVSGIGGTFVQIVFSILGTTAGPLVGLYMLGGLWPRAGARGAMLGGVLGFILTAWIAMGAYMNRIHTTPLRMPMENCPARNLNMSRAGNLSGAPYGIYTSTPPAWVTTELLPQGAARVVRDVSGVNNGSNSALDNITQTIEGVSVAVTEGSTTTTTTAAVSDGVTDFMEAVTGVSDAMFGSDNSTQGAGAGGARAGPGKMRKGAEGSAEEPKSGKVSHEAPGLSGLTYMYSITYLWYPTIGILVTLIIGITTSFIPFMAQKQKVPDYLLFPCARACGRSCFSSYVSTEKGAEYEAFTLQRGEDNTLSLKREVKHYPPSGYDQNSDEENQEEKPDLQGEDGEELVLAGNKNEKLIVDVSESSI